MADKMLIDASHSEETRVVVVRGNRIEEFDFESQHKKQIRGNIYLAKVTRVEPSLQAAFVDYGGNRHGFLAFAEIHPDYYQIPLADRQALLRAEAEEHRRDEDIEHVETGTDLSDEDAPEAAAPVAAAPVVTDPAEAVQPETIEAVEETSAVAEATADASAQAAVEDAPVAAPEADAAEKPKKPRRSRAKPKKAAEEAVETAVTDLDGSDDSTPDEMAAMVDSDSVSEDARRRNDDDEDDDDDHDQEKEVIESVGAEDAMEEVPDRVMRKPRKQYRIQEVIKRRQILLVQVAKEERGNKGAALTTYLSLAGRYSVLMPNTARGGGISRKITSPQDRKRLKEIARALEVPQGMGVILRTAGANRTKVEVKRDFEYLMRLWENVRTLTLNSVAPCLVYEEGSLIKRSIRDLYNKDISEVVVAGEDGYREAKDFMKMLMPSHAKVVQPYRDIHPIFSRSGIEGQLDRMLQPQVTLKSGGYIIINQTEALVAVDVNSGRSTREHSIEDTALQTNLEAAEEVARQLRLRDLAGLIVIDFIDMEEKRNNRAVEKRLKDHLKNDRARIQVGRISHFGLLEMSRQRIRASVLESTTQVCSHCGGTGHVRSQSSIALHVLRGVEEYLLKNTTHNITVRTTPEIALYLLNHKRSTLTDYESRFGVAIIIAADASVGGAHFAIDRGEAVENPVKIENLIMPEPEPEDDDPIVFDSELEDEEEEEEIVQPKAAAAASADAQGTKSDDQNGRKRKRRRRRRGGKGNGGGDEASAHGEGNGFGDQSSDDQDDDGDDSEGDEEGGNTASASETEESQRRKRRRRGKRGGRRNREDGTEGSEGEASGDDQGSDDGAEDNGSEGSGDGAAEMIEAVTETVAEQAPAATAAIEAGSDDKPAKAKRTRKPKAAAEVPAAAADEAPAVAEDASVNTPVVEASEEAPATDVEAVESGEQDDDRPARANRGSNVSNSEPVVRSNAAPAKPEDDKPKKAGWWQRRGFL